MGCKIIFSPQAIADLEAAVRFIAEENPNAAARVGNALIDRVAILENFFLARLALSQTSRRAQAGFAALHHFLPFSGAA